MSTVAEIPLSPSAQAFSIDLGATRYQFTVRWNDAPLGGWILDIADVGANPLISGIPLVTGVDLLAPYTKLDFGGQLWVATDGNAALPPRIDNLGSPGGARLYWIVGAVPVPPPEPQFAPGRVPEAMGAQGPPGIQGIQGIQGPIGPRGQQGPAGPTDSSPYEINATGGAATLPIANGNVFIHNAGGPLTLVPAANPVDGLRLDIIDADGTASPTTSIIFQGRIAGVTNPVLLNSAFGHVVIQFHNNNWYRVG